MNSHLSRPHVAVRLKPPVEAHRANGSLQSALLRIGFAGPHGLPCAGELLPRLSTLTGQGRRYLSVALSLGSPPAAVSRYSCPVELGLSSDICFRLMPDVYKRQFEFNIKGLATVILRVPLNPFSIAADKGMVSQDIVIRTKKL